ncbi:integrase arm-type DNA-binding domain-containing protein [Desulfovibrio porci]|uniref:tyrosine-type recombinase/integrase n=1 Tax=Desulfovibrio porci TaxID=2605782 RepID=UPI002A83B49A|nr:integrase arm-type DNA-binding domain-containing protein [Desulfovibrio porci]MDY3810663.1 integrase arm-type DNA-binding domain-containing protein [Desulfovibrio porci]
MGHISAFKGEKPHKNGVAPMPLTDTAIRNAKPGNKPAKLSDGGGLYLEVAPTTGGKWWRLKYRIDGREKRISLGTYPTVSLKEARRRRDEAKEQLAHGLDPSEVKKEARQAALVERLERENTFEAVAREWFASYSPTLSEKHSKKLYRYLEKLIFPVFGSKGVSTVEPADILAVARPKEAQGRIETAHKICQLCGQVLEFAKITGKVKYNVGMGLSKALQPIRAQSYPAITDPKKIGILLRDIDAYEGYFSISYFLKILPYVFTRPSELRLAQWSEFDLAEMLWRIPAKRMKMRKEHIVPLAPQVMGLLSELWDYSSTSAFLFPSTRAKSNTISDVGPLAALRNLGYDKNTMCLHGFRAMASTRLNEMGYRADVIEAQLAHKEPDACGWHITAPNTPKSGGR